MKEPIVFPVLDLTDPDTHVGKHSVWLPKSEIKVPFQWGGRVQKYQKPNEQSWPLSTIAEEVAFLRWLSVRHMAPRVGRCVYFERVISQHLGFTWEDPCGAYGFEFERVDPDGRAGEFDVNVLKRSGVIEGSEGAWNDIIKPVNILNGWCVDVRRSWWDRLAFKGDIESMPSYDESVVGIVDDLLRDGSFPFQERSQPYQEFYLAREWHAAEREVCNRARIMGFDVKPGDTVLDLGTCTGGFLTYAHLLGAARCVGLDYQREFVGLAQRIARANGHNIGYRQADLNAPPSMIAPLVEWLREVFSGGIDHLLVLSMGKHLGEEKMWAWIDLLKARHTYIETNAVKEPPFPYEFGVHQRGGRQIGFTEDRNRRVVYRIDRA